MSIQVKNLSLTLPISKDKATGLSNKEIIKDVNVSFAKGRLTAIMGASGAGKTSLLYTLSGEVPSNAQVRGTICLDGHETKSSKLKKISGFVYQDDILHESVTVREAITMAADLRLSQLNGKERTKKVDMVIEELGLKKASPNMIGSVQKKGISGGERKRTSIAMELVTDPAILFLDEPTTGLDTYTAFNVIESLKELARKGRTIVATIHQPSSKMFMAFDDLVLLEDGKVIYAGPVSSVLDYFSSLGYVCPEFENPADFLFMDVLEGGDDKQAQPGKLAAAWSQSPQKAGLDKTMAQDIASQKLLEAKPSTFQKEQASFFVQFGCLLQRNFRSIGQNWIAYFCGVFLPPIIMGSIFSWVSYDIARHEPLKHSKKLVSALFFLGTSEIFASMIRTILLFSNERKLFISEAKGGYYSVFSYLLSKLVIEVPVTLAVAPIASGMMFRFVGLGEGWSVLLKLVFTQQLVNLVGTSLGMLLSTSSSDPQVPLALMPMVGLPFMIFGGVLIILSSVPWYFSFMPYLSPNRWSFSAMAQTILKGFKFSQPKCLPFPCTGEQVLERFDLLNDYSVETCWMALTGLWLGFIFITVLVLLMLTRTK